MPKPARIHDRGQVTGKTTISKEMLPPKLINLMRRGTKERVEL